MATRTIEATDLKVYYDESDPVIGEQAQDVLTNYSHIATQDLIPHIRAIRDRAWQVFKYPCVGKYYFLDFSICKSERYAEVLARLQSGQTLLDLACCFGQDVRKIVHDGAPATQVYGSDLQQGFLDLGFDLFRDRSRLRDNFTAGDFFNDDVAGLRGRTFDMIHAASFFHLFSWDEQVDAMSRAVRLLEPVPGSIVFGRQTSVMEAKELDHPASRSGKMYRHDIASFVRLVDEVAARTKISLEVSVNRTDDAEQLEQSLGWHRVSFSIVIC